MHIGSIRRKPIGRSHHTVGFYKEWGKIKKGDSFCETNHFLETLLFLPTPASSSYYTTTSGQNTFSF